MSWLRATGTKHLCNAKDRRHTMEFADLANGLGNVIPEQRGVTGNTGVDDEIDFAGFGERRK